MMTNAKEVNKYFRAAKWNFNKAVELAKKSLVVGEIHFAGSEKKARARKAKAVPEPEGKGLPDLDKDNKFYNGKK